MPDDEPITLLTERTLAAERALADASPANIPEAVVELARCEMAQGRPSRAEPLLRQALDVEPANQKARRALTVLLAESGRPADALAMSAELDDTPEGRIVRGWIRSADGDHEAHVDVARAAGLLGDDDPLMQRLAFQTRVRSDGSYPGEPLLQWVHWLGEETHRDPYGVEIPAAWVDALALSHDYFPAGLPSKLDGLEALVLAEVARLEPWHPVRLRAYVVAGTHMESGSVARVLIAHAAQHAQALDPLLVSSLGRYINDAWEHAGRPSLKRINQQLDAIALGTRAGFGLSTPITANVADYYACLMRTSTAAHFLRALDEGASIWTAESVGLTVEGDAATGEVVVSFAATHPESSDRAIRLTRAEIDEIVEFARQGGILPSESEQVGRNDPCPCGSGRKYKRCCGA